MPIYEYHCPKCGHEFEVLQKKFDVDEMPCEACGAPAKRMISNTSFVLKGTGWYVTDYKSNGGCSASGGNELHHKKTDNAAPAASCASSNASGGCSSCSGSAAAKPAASTASSTTSGS